VAHSCDSVRNGHTLPPCAEVLMTLRERDRSPRPQVLVHGLQGVNAVSVQSREHSPREHVRVSFIGDEHTAPPLAAKTVI